jgi:hypothetical protein
MTHTTRCYFNVLLYLASPLLTEFENTSVTHNSSNKYSGGNCSTTRSSGGIGGGSGSNSSSSNISISSGSNTQIWDPFVLFINVVSMNERMNE